MESQTIKSIVPYVCPHCSKDFFVELTTIPTMLTGILTQEDINRAKDTVRSALETSPELDNKQVVDLMNWIDDEETIFGPSDVEKILESIK